MFVADNSLKSVKHYFNDRLKPVFSDREIRMMFQLCAEKRLHITPADLLLSDQIRMSESDLLFFRSVVKRLLNHEPFQYIHGETEFYGLILKTDARALIPRPETEELVDWIVKSQYADMQKIVDVCSGSGCIALALKQQFPQAAVTGIDVSQAALSLSIENAALNQLDVRFEQWDILSRDPETEENTMDIIVSNPPYVKENEKTGIQEHVLEHEPHIALFVSDDSPLIFYDTITSFASRALKPGGWLYFEINEQYGAEMVELLKKYGFEQVELKQDLQEKDRMVRGRKPA